MDCLSSECRRRRMCFTLEVGILPCKYTRAALLAFLEAACVLLNKQTTTASLLPGSEIVRAFSSKLSSVPGISNWTLILAIQTTIFLMSSPQIFDSIPNSNIIKSAFVKTTRIFWSKQHEEGNGWGTRGNCPLAARRAHTRVCVSLPGFGKPLLPLLPPEL